MPTEPVKQVKIASRYSEIFRVICQFLPYLRSVNSGVIRLLDQISPDFYTMQRHSCHLSFGHQNCDIAIRLTMRTRRMKVCRQNLRFLL